jgi:hypothetical protein
MKKICLKIATIVVMPLVAGFVGSMPAGAEAPQEVHTTDSFTLISHVCKCLARISSAIRVWPAATSWWSRMAPVA